MPDLPAPLARVLRLPHTVLYDLIPGANVRWAMEAAGAVLTELAPAPGLGLPRWRVAWPGGLPWLRTPDGRLLIELPDGSLLHDARQGRYRNLLMVHPTDPLYGARESARDHTAE